MRCWFIIVTSVYAVILLETVVSVPRFDSSALLRDVLIPADAAVGSVIYRLRASDPTFNYPLVFNLVGQVSVILVESLNCSRFNSVCQANIVLKKRLEVDRFYDFSVDVRNQRGENARLNCSFRATNATTPVEKIFPGAPSLLMVSELARRNTELGTILAKGNPNRTRAVLLELWGSPEFGLYQKLVTDRDAEATIILLSQLDYEKKTVHHLTVLANDPWTNMAEDTRNIAGWPLLIEVIDEQDTPPIFTIAPPTTTLSPNLKTGDPILKVHAEDGDKGNPREIRYSILSDGNPSAKFFEINDKTGQLNLANSLSNLMAMSHTGQPILLTVVAEEIRSSPNEAPAQSTSVQLALIPPGVTAGLPTFGAIEYNALVDENSPVGTVLDLPQAEVNTQPGDVVTLELANNNGTFEITPTVVEGHAKFKIMIHDPKLLDYEERKSVQCFVVAKEIAPGNYTSKVKLTVVLNDVNDNPPTFSQDVYHANIQEHANMGTNVLVVEASDVDTGLGGKIKFTKLNGEGSNVFKLDPDSGLITVSNSLLLDAEVMPVITLSVEAADENGEGLTATTTVIINLIDINDQEPQFEKSVYEFILNKDKTGFTIPAFVKATDKDISPPNNEVHYEIINSPTNLYINELTGELTISNTWNINDVQILRVRAWDGGIPRHYNECEMRIYPPEGTQGKMVFIIPGKYSDRRAVAETLKNLTRNRVLSIDRIRPYTGDEPGATDITNDYDKEKTVVDATVTYSKGSIVDLTEVDKIFSRKNEETRIREKEVIRIQETNSSGLLWFLVLFLILLIIAAIALMLCCLCKQCPLYNYVLYKKQKRSPEIEKIQKVNIAGSGQGRESKSVQVAEWFGRKEVWTPEHHMVDVEAESLKRHEYERGSDRGGGRRTILRQNQTQEAPREQLYIREGNTDILRLVTRGGEPRPVTLIADPVYNMGDSGKDILMQRFIEQQQTEAARAQILLPNAVSRLQTEHELLEASLRQQNALLRQLLIDRERDLRLETQSLPAGTQTDQDIGTQTEPLYLRPPRRKVQSDNDQSDVSDDDDEIAIIKAKAKRRNGQKVYHVRRKIKTPIQEEVELEIIEKPQIVKSTEKRPKIRQTKTSELRQKRASSEARSSQSLSSKSGLRREVLREISASLEHSDVSDSETEYYNRKGEPSEFFSEDSLEISPRSSDKTTDSNKQRYHSESDLRLVSTRGTRNGSENHRKEKTKSQSHIDLTSIGGSKSKSEKNNKRRGSRYMEWYTKNQEPKPKVRKESTKTKEVNKKEPKQSEPKSTVNSRLLKDTESSARKKVDSKKNGIGPEHPLLQHSEHRFEVQYPSAPNQQQRRPDEDADSGIALTRPPIAQKKSVFTIAYNDMHTNQLRAESTTSP